MTIINIEEFSHFSEEDIYEFLKIESPRLILVQIPGDIDNETGYPYEFNYYRAIYVGQLLDQISTEFLYNFPEPCGPDYFAFLIMSDQWEKLAGLLYHFSQGFCNDNYTPDFDILISEEVYLWSDNEEEFACLDYLEMIASF